jgi:hypothetical protein
MFKSDDFPQEHLATLAAQINSWLGDMIRSGHLPAARKSSGSVSSTDSDGEMDRTAFQLGEQFVMVSLNHPEVISIEQPNYDLRALVALTGRRHHQIKYGPDAIAYARSLVDDNENLCQLFATRLAQNVQKAMVQLDKYEDGEFADGTWRVRLLTVPPFHTHAFFLQKVNDANQVLEDDSQLFVISAPDWMERLRSHTLLSSSDFLSAFEGEKPIAGLRDIEGHMKIGRT